MKKALVLSGGGAKGAAHVGAIYALEELGFIPDMIVGTSIGAVVGAGYSILKDAKRLWEISRDIHKFGKKKFPRLKKIPNWLLCFFSHSFKSIVPSKIYFSIFEKYLNDLSFEDMQIEFYCTAFDIKSGELKVFNSGNLIKILEASMSIPGLFPVVELDEYVLVDGGVLYNLPTKVAREKGADLVIAVDLLGNKSLGNFENADSIMWRFDSIREIYLRKLSYKFADIVIKPDVKDVGTLDFEKSLLLFERGKKAVYDLKEKILEMIQ